MAGCSHFAGRVRSAAEIDKIGIMGGGIFNIFRVVKFAVKLFVHIIFRGGFCELFRKDSGKPKDKDRNADSADD